MPDTKGTEAVRQYERLMSKRGTWVGHWTDVQDLVRPNTVDFSASMAAITKGQKKNLKIYDGTAVWANSMLAAGLHSFLTNPTDRWFNIRIEGVETEALDMMSRAWLELVADIIYREYADPDVNFYPIIHQDYLDLGAFGTSVLYQDYNSAKDHLVFKSFALADSAIAENEEGFVDTNFRKVRMSPRQMAKMFGEEKVPKAIREKKDQYELHDIIHGVFPRTDRDFKKMTNVNMPWASVWVVQQTKDILRESGFRMFPYHISRWMKISGEEYGRSPAMNCLPDIKMLNQMSKTIIKAAQKVVDPPLLTPDDGFALPIKTAPGSLIYYDASMLDHNTLIRPLETKGRIDIGLEMENQRREHIMRCFFVDLFIRPKKKERQFTTEIVDDREEMLRQLAPVIGRLQSEKLGPILKRSYALLDEHGRIPPAPPQLAGVHLDIDYVSPAALAQLGTKSLGIQQFLNDLIPMSSVRPDVLDAVDVDKFAALMARLRNVSPLILNSPERIAEIRQQRQEAEQRAQISDAAKKLASAEKDLSMAEKNRRVE